MRTSSILSLAIVLVTGLVSAQDIAAPRQPLFSQTLESIQILESQRDPKCYATASRLEDFMYGTPLTEEARNEKITLQKSLIDRLMTSADAFARASGLDEIDEKVLLEATQAIWH